MIVGTQEHMNELKEIFAEFLEEHHKYRVTTQRLVNNSSGSVEPTFLLAVNTPHGTWICNEISNDAQKQISIAAELATYKSTKAIVMRSSDKETQTLNWCEKDSVQNLRTRLGDSGVELIDYLIFKPNDFTVKNALSVLPRTDRATEFTTGIS